MGKLQDPYILDDRGRRVGKVQGQFILDGKGRRIGKFDGDKLLDKNGSKITRRNEITKDIDGPGGITLAAL